jgi:hypothetical protein
VSFVRFYTTNFFLVFIYKITLSKVGLRAKKSKAYHLPDDDRAVVAKVIEPTSRL